MNAEIKLLRCGNCEELKVGVHATALALAVVMGAYNTAAWLLRRDRHLAVNAVLYTALSAWEVLHVTHHWAELPGHRVSPLRPVVVEKTAA
jgi:hypothetical protein